MELINIISFYLNIETLVVVILVFGLFIYSTKIKLPEIKKSFKINLSWKAIVIIGILSLIFFILAKWIFQTYINNISVESDLIWYDAKLLNMGLIPYKDFITREPLLLVIASILIRIFNFNQNILLNIYLLFLFGYIFNVYNIFRTLYSKKSGVIAGIIAMITPLFLKFPSANYIFYGAIYLFAISLCIYLLIKAYGTENKIYYILSGLCLGLTIHIYRGAIPYLFLLPITIVILKDYKNQFKNFLLYQGGIVIGYVIPVLILYRFLNFEWINNLLQADKTILIIIASLFIPSMLNMWFKLTKKLSVQNNLIIFATILIILGISFYYFNGVNTTVSDKFGVINDYVRYSGYYLFVGLFLVLNILIQVFFNKLKNLKYLIYSINFGLLCLIIAGTEHVARGTSYYLDLPFRIFFYAILLLGTILIKDIIKITESFYKDNKYAIIPSVMVILFFLSNIFFIDWLDNYVISLIFPAVFIFIQFLHYLYKKNYLKLLIQILVLTLLFSIFTVMFFYNNNYNTSEISHQELNFVEDYLSAAHIQNQTIFTANPTFAFRSNNLILGNISHPLIYTKELFWDTYNPYNTIKSPDEIVNEMKVQNLQYIIVDQRTRSIFLKDLNPGIRDYINDNYSSVAEFQTIQILKKN